MELMNFHQERGGDGVDGLRSCQNANRACPGALELDAVRWWLLRILRALSVERGRKTAGAESGNCDGEARSREGGDSRPGKPEKEKD